MAKKAEPTIKSIKMPGDVEALPGDKSPSRIALLLWGPSSAGKSTFAATGPGDKLWFAFGDNEAQPVSRRKDVLIADYSHMGYDKLFLHAQSDNPFGLDKILGENQDIGTVVVDSATALTYRALQKAVLEDHIGMGKGFVPSMEAPGIAAYGGRNAIVLQTLTGFLRVTAKHNVSIIITAHEDDPTMKNEVVGNKTVEVIDYIGIQLGGKLVNNMTWRLSEIWHMRDNDGKRELTVRNYANRRPMKTRMFTPADRFPRFELTYTPDKPDDAPGQMTIAAWHDEWLDGGRKSIKLPRLPGKG